MTNEEAWTLAIEMARKSDPRRREQLDSMLAKGRPFKEVGKLAAYGCQFETLHAEPSATVPCSLIEPVDAVLARGDDGVAGGDYAAAVLAKRLHSTENQDWHDQDKAPACGHRVRGRFSSRHSTE
jgi:hypothetical protein